MLDGVTREEVRDAIIDAVQNPVASSRGGRPTSAVCEVEKMVVVLEEPRHFHVALKVSLDNYSSEYGVWIMEY